MAILLCLVASFLALRHNSQFSGILFFKYLSFALRLALIALDKDCKVIGGSSKEIGADKVHNKGVSGRA